VGCILCTERMSDLAGDRIALISERFATALARGCGPEPRKVRNASPLHAFLPSPTWTSTMLMRTFLVLLSSPALLILAHDTYDAQQPLNDQDALLRVSKEPWLDKYGGQIDQPFSGPLSFAHLPYARCIEEAGRSFDIAILGLPFDTAVSYSGRTQDARVAVPNILSRTGRTLRPVRDPLRKQAPALDSRLDARVEEQSVRAGI
jgi:hypothetical protein